jgi:DnaA regulatory inactivator Hda
LPRRIEEKASPVPAQIPLHLKWEPEYRLENFFLHDGNRLAFRVASEIVQGTFRGPTSVVFFGPRGVGKTHLLLGLLNALEPAGHYVSGEAAGSGLEDVRPVKLLLVDDLEKFVGHDQQRWLFAGYNDLLRSGGQMVLASESDPVFFKGLAEDLKSRLLGGLVIELMEPDEAGRKEVLSKLASDRRIRLSEGVAGFLLSRIDRSIPSLLWAIDRIDQFSLAGKRPITIPLAKQALDL